MSKVRSSIVTKIIVVATLVLFMIAQHPGPLWSAEVVKATVEVKHKPLKHFVAGHRISVEAKVVDPQGVSLVRCYFRAGGQSDWVFVGMKAGEKDAFAGILPSPAAETKAIEYLFLVVNGKNQVVKTQTFKTEQKETKDVPTWQSAASDGTISVSTELPTATVPAGFTDSIAMNVVESSVRFGFVAGFYSATQVRTAGGATAGGTTAATGSATGALATAVSVGTVTASAGISTTMIVGAGAAVVAVVAGVAVASGGGGDGGGGSDSTSAGCSLYAGNWEGTWGGTDCNGAPFSIPGYLTIGSDCSVNNCSTNGCGNGRVVGDTISFSFLDAYCGQYEWRGSFSSPSSVGGTWSATLGGGGTWSATKR